MKGRLFLYGAILALLPLLTVSYHHFQIKNMWKEVQQEIEKVQLLLETKERRQAINSLVRKKMSQVNIHLMDELKKRELLNHEKDALERLFASRTFTGNEAAERRYAFLSSNENRLDFVEGNYQDQVGVSECEISLFHPVEVDNRDIKKLLTLIEEREGGPHLLFTDWKMTRKATGLGSEVFELNFKLLKREYDS